MSASYATIKVEIADHIATVTFDNPKQRNPFTAEFKQDMLTLCRDMQARDDIDVPHRDDPQVRNARGDDGSRDARPASLSLAQMVPELAPHMLEYYREKEISSSVDAEYLSRQPSVDAHARAMCSVPSHPSLL